MIGCDCEVCQSADKHDNRLRSSILLEYAGTRLVVDTTPDFRYQMLRENVQSLDAIIYTHGHKDHVAGLDDVRAFNFFSGKAMPIYASAATQEVLEREFGYAFADHKYPGVPSLEVHSIIGKEFRVGQIPVQPINVWHLHMPVYGFRFGPLTYITDANRIDEAEKEKIKGSQILVLNALRKQKHISHFSLGEAIDLVNELQVPQAYFTHISHQLGLHAEVNAELPEGIQLAYDGLKLEINF